MKESRLYWPDTSIGPLRGAGGGAANETIQTTSHALSRQK
jgi:hypothetical protein